MGQINNMSFNVKFDLTSIPTLVLTDTTVSPPSGFVGIYTITLPDGYTRSGNISYPDITSSGGVFSFPLRLDSLGNVQEGQYTITLTASAPSYISTDFTRTFQFTYAPVDLVLTEMFDVFTPSLKYNDSTVYQVSNYNASSTTRSWNANSTPTGAITSTTQLFDIVKAGKYYDAYYTISLTSTVLYTHQVYSFLTVQEAITKTVQTSAQTPPNLNSVVSSISYLKSVVDGLVNTTYSYEQAKEDFQSAQVYFTHIIDKLKLGVTTDLYSDIKSLINVIYLGHPPTYTPTNLPINPYDFTEFAGAPKWGKIGGDISSQTDLWAYIQLFTKRDNYVFDQQQASSSWDITHSMGKFPSVTIVDTSGDEVDALVNHISNNHLIITFSAPLSGKAYLN